MNRRQPPTKERVRHLLTELDAELAQLDRRQAERRKQRENVLKLRAICEPYMRDNPTLTVGEALEMDWRARPWAYRKVN